MNALTTILTSTLTTIVVIGIGFFGATTVYANGYGPHGQGGMHGKGKQHGFMSMVCSPKRAQKIEKGLVRLEKKLDLNDGQANAWDDLVTQINDSQSELDAFCAIDNQKEQATTTPDRLIKMQAMMAKAVELIGEVQPPLEAFYAELNEDQKKILDNMGPGHHRR